VPGKALNGVPRIHDVTMTSVIFGGKHAKMRFCQSRQIEMRWLLLIIVMLLLFFIKPQELNRMSKIQDRTTLWCLEKREWYT
jgi:hypothetical protein